MSDPWAYGDNVKKHFADPKNVLTVTEEEFAADGKGTIGSPACGDVMMVLVKIKGDKILDLKWKTFGCASAIASTSILSEMVLRDGGMSLENAYKITPEDILKELGGLPANKIHCSVLGDKALRSAIDDYHKKNNLENPFAEKDPTIVCECLNISEEDIRMEVLEGAKDFETLQERTKIATDCGKCKEKAIEIQKKYVEKYYKDDVYNPKGED